MNSWASTPNTYEAAACVSIGIGARPVTTEDHRRARPKSTVWNLAEHSDDGAHHTSGLRRAAAAGTLEQTTPLHPYLISLHTYHNRERLLDAQHGTSMVSVQVQAKGMPVPNLWRLQRGPLPPLPPNTFLIELADQDATVALLTLGCQLVRISGGHGAHTYFITRFILQGHGVPALDAHALLEAHRQGRTEVTANHPVFVQALHALHCLRELRKRQYATTFITVSHRVPGAKGAAINERAASHAFSHVQRRLNVKIG